MTRIMRTTLHGIAVAAITVLLSGPASAGELTNVGERTSLGDNTITNASERFVILAVEQPQHDLNRSSGRLNLMFDSKEGRVWVLRYTTMPGSNETGYVWVEMPFKAVQQVARRVRRAR